MPQHVGRNFPPLQFRHAGRTTFNESIDTEPGVRSSVPAEEYGIAVRTSLDLLRKNAFDVRQQRALTYLSALSVQGYKSMAAITAADPQIAHFQLCCFGDTCPSVLV